MPRKRHHREEIVARLRNPDGMLIEVCAGRLDVEDPEAGARRMTCPQGGG